MLISPPSHLTFKYTEKSKTFPEQNAEQKESFSVTQNYNLGFILINVEKGKIS